MYQYSNEQMNAVAIYLYSKASKSSHSGKDKAERDGSRAQK